MNNLTTVLDILIYSLVCGFCSYSIIFALPMGLTLFSGGMLLLTFVGACASIFRMLVRKQ